MITSSELRALLDGLARRFENRPQRDHDLKGVNALGWGQFLDGQPTNNQVGPYGTCFGVIARSLANRGSDNLDKQVSALLKEWWTTRTTNPHYARLLGQTIRLAIFYLAIRLSTDESLNTLMEEVKGTLINSVRPDGMWGNYVMSGGIQDPSPRLIATSLVVLSFTLFRLDSESMPDLLVTAVKRLEDRILGTQSLPRLHVAIASAAILSLPGYKPGSKARSRISRLAYASQTTLPELGVYFYDYEFDELSTGESQGTQRRAFKTDYFIVPTELALGIAGYQPSSPLYLRYRADSTLSLLVKNMQGFDGYYRPDNEQRISSVNQGWVAMYLALAERALDHPAAVLIRSWRFIPRIWYACIKQRPDHFWLDSIMLSLCGVSILVGSLFPDSGSTADLMLVRACTAVLAFLAGRLYAPVFLKRLFMERQ